MRSEEKLHFFPFLSPPFFLFFSAKFDSGSKYFRGPQRAISYPQVQMIYKSPKMFLTVQLIIQTEHSCAHIYSFEDSQLIHQWENDANDK